MPAAPSAAAQFNRFYFLPDTVQQALQKLQYNFGHENFGGVMLWDATSDYQAGNPVSQVVLQTVFK